MLKHRLFLMITLYHIAAHFPRTPSEVLAPQVFLFRILWPLRVDLGWGSSARHFRLFNGFSHSVTTLLRRQDLGRRLFRHCFLSFHATVFGFSFIYAFWFSSVTFFSSIIFLGFCCFLRKLQGEILCFSSHDLFVLFAMPLSALFHFLSLLSGFRSSESSSHSVWSAEIARYRIRKNVISLPDTFNM